MRGSGGVAAQPGVEVLGSLEVEQGNREGLKRSEGERLDAGLLAGSEVAEAVLEQAEGDAKASVWRPSWRPSCLPNPKISR